MILADKIMEERKRNGWSQEELAEKLGVSRQAVSKWESAGSSPDLQRILQMSQLFGVSTDYLLKDEMEPDGVYQEIEPTMERRETVPVRSVSMEEANDFLDRKREGAPRIANGVFMCIVSPALLILLSGMADDRRFHVTEAFAAGLGLVFLFVMVAVAVFLFITCGIRQRQMEYLEKEVFETEYGVSGMVKERRRSYEPVFTRGIAVGVGICILSVVPLLLAGVVDAPDAVTCAMVSLLLLLVAAGVNMIVRVSIIKGSYDMLLQEGEFSKKEKQAKTKLDTLSGVYWCLATAIYLGWSFWTMRWDITWILWPVAGVLFAAVSGTVRLVIGADGADQ